jgi:hypothetical protein
MVKKVRYEPRYRSSTSNDVCLRCGKKGMTNWKMRALAHGVFEFRYCRYCHHHENRQAGENKQ